MPLERLLAATRVRAAAQAQDSDAVLDAAAQLLADDQPGRAAAVASGLRQRERLGSTAIGHGIAIPHGRSDAFAQPRGAFLRLSQPVDFGANDNEPVDLVFALIVPQHFTQEHLQLLSELAERFADEGYREALRGAADDGALLKLLAEPVALRSGSRP